MTLLSTGHYRIKGTINEQNRTSLNEGDAVIVHSRVDENQTWKGTVSTIDLEHPIAEIAKKHGVLFHTDAVQAVGHVPIDVEKLHVDLLSMSGHKLGAPKGIGAIYIRKGTRISPLIFGGAQEKKLRAGTENIAGIVGLGKAAELAVAEMEETTKKLTALRDKLIHGILESIPDSRLNGHPTDRLPGNCNISFSYIEGESLLLLLDALGIAASSGSACTSGSLDPSHVLMAIGLPHEIAHGSLRLTIDRENTEEQVDFILEKLPGLVQRLRDMSPVYPGKKA